MLEDFILEEGESLETYFVEYNQAEWQIMIQVHCFCESLHNGWKTVASQKCFHTFRCIADICTAL